MNEARWLACEGPGPMLHFMRRKASERKLRLFACACVRRVEYLLGSYLSRQALEVAEHYADGSADEHQRRKARQVIDYGGGGEAHWGAFQACECCVSHELGSEIAAEVSGLTTPDRAQGAQQQSGPLRDIFGNPFRSIRLNPAWLAWESRTIPKLAEAVYEERAFDRLPILADALEEMGCDLAELLTHLRGLGPHVRGCWAVDLLLGKG